MREKLVLTISAIDNVCKKILQKENYEQEMPMCVQAIQECCLMLLQQNPNSQDILYILQDIVYGMTQKDEVFLLDVLRFGLKVRLEQAYYELENNQPEGIYE